MSVTETSLPDIYNVLLKRVCQIFITFSVKTEMAILKDELS